MGKKYHKKMFFIYLFSFICIAAGFVFLLIFLELQSKNLIAYPITINAPTTPDTPVSMTINVSKSWTDLDYHRDHPFGAQYDCMITNHTDTPLKDWALMTLLPDNFIIDSSWSGNYQFKNNKLITTPVDYNMLLQPGDTITLGMILYSDKQLTFQSADFSCYPVYKYYHSPYFYILIGLFVFWCIALFIHIVLMQRTSKYIKRQEKDSAIILQSMKTFAGLIDAKDTYTRGHSIRVASYSAEIARRMKIPKEEITTLYYIALMHDCGKMGIPDAVLNKPGKLTAEERHIIESHTTIGGRILESFTAIDGIRDGALYHHERFDGTGYPSGLSGNSIPLHARIIGVADAYDAMSSNRCYRQHIERPLIIRELKENSGTQFDPQIVPYMLDMIEDGYVCIIQKDYPDSL